MVRKRHPRDRRAFLVWPTEPGRTAKIEEIADPVMQQRCFLAPLTAAERQELGALLKRLQRPPKRLPSCGAERGSLLGYPLLKTGQKLSLVSPDKACFAEDVPGHGGVDVLVAGQPPQRDRRVHGEQPE